MVAVPRDGIADIALKESGLDAILILQVHDELIVDAAEKDADAAKEILVREMESAAKLSVLNERGK